MPLVYLPTLYRWCDIGLSVKSLTTLTYKNLCLPRYASMLMRLKIIGNPLTLLQCGQIRKKAQLLLTLTNNKMATRFQVAKIMWIKWPSKYSTQYDGRSHDLFYRFGHLLPRMLS